MGHTRAGHEARRTPRRAFEHPIGVLWGGTYGVVQAAQLSEGGLLFLSHDPFIVHQQVVVTLLMPGGGDVVTRGELIYERKGEDGVLQYGVKFISLQIPQRRLIRNYVAAKTEAEAQRESNDYGGGSGLAS